MNLISRILIFIILLASTLSCSQNTTTISDFDFVIGQWKSDVGRRLYSECNCYKAAPEEIKCDVNTYKRKDSTTYSIVKLHIKKESGEWQIKEDIFGTRRQYKVFDIDKFKTRVFTVKNVDSLQVNAMRAPENDGRQYFVLALSKDKKLVITDYFYTFNFKKVITETDE